MVQNKTWKIIDIISWATDFFQKRNIESPRLNIELIICEVLKINRLELYLKYDLPLSANELTKIKEFTIRRANYEPLQYIFGKTTFYNSELIINKNVLIPRPETELLVDIICRNEYLNLSQDSKNILDIGCGSGAISIALAKKFPSANIFAVDISDEALKLSQKNAELNDVIKNITFQKMNILKEYPVNQKFDLIVSNPPYISLSEYQKLPPEIKFYEPKLSLTDESDGLHFYRRYAEIFPNLLNHNGKFYLEIGYNQLENISNIFKRKSITIKSYKDYNKIDRIISN